MESNTFSFPPVLAAGTTKDDILEYLSIQATALVVSKIADKIYTDNKQHSQQLNLLKDAVQNIKKQFKTP